MLSRPLQHSLLLLVYDWPAAGSFEALLQSSVREQRERDTHRDSSEDCASVDGGEHGTGRTPGFSSVSFSPQFKGSFFGAD